MTAVSTNPKSTTSAAAVSVWFTVKDLSQRYQCSERHLFALMAGGMFPVGQRLGRLRRWSRQALEVWEGAGCPPANGNGADK